MGIRTAGVVLLLAVLLVGCGNFGQSIREIIDEKYALQDTVKSSTDPDDTAFVYVAQNKTIDEVSDGIQKEMSPERTSDKNEGKQVLVYDQSFVTLMKDEENPDNVLIEVADYQFVRDNYQPSFFQGLFALYVLNDLFDVDDWGKRQKSRCVAAASGCYGGYVGSGGRYKGPTRPPTFRNSLRGGGPGAGK